MEITRLTQETINEFNERKEIYKRILEKALSDIYTELEEMEFDTGSIDINIRFFNHDFAKSFAANKEMSANFSHFFICSTGSLSVSAQI